MRKSGCSTSSRTNWPVMPKIARGLKFLWILVLKLETSGINRIHHGCPVEIGKSQPEGPPVPVGNEARRVSHWNGGPEGWDFPFSTGHP